MSINGNRKSRRMCTRIMTFVRGITSKSNFCRFIKSDDLNSARENTEAKWGYYEDESWSRREAEGYGDG